MAELQRDFIAHSLGIWADLRDGLMIFDGRGYRIHSGKFEGGPACKNQSLSIWPIESLPWEMHAELLTDYPGNICDVPTPRELVLLTDSVVISGPAFAVFCRRLQKPRPLEVEFRFAAAVDVAELKQTRWPTLASYSINAPWAALA